MAVRTDNAIVINAPLETVWETTNDVESWPHLFTEYAEAEILERKGNTVVFRLSMHPDENGKIWSWVSERTIDPKTHSVKARRITAIASSPSYPSTVRTSRPSALTASIRQERMGRPSINTVQAPQTPCSQPTCVPVRR